MIRIPAVVLILLVALTTLVPGPALADATPPANGTVKESLELARLKGLLDRTGSGSAAPVSVTPLDTARIVLSRNLAVKETEIGKQYAQQALREAEALFDPVLRASASYSNTAAFTREEEAKKYLKNTVSVMGSEPVYVMYGDSSPIKYLRFDRERVAGYYNRTAHASEPDPWGEDDTQDYSLGLSADIPWGASLDFSLILRNRKNFWLNDDKSWGDYGRPWRSSFAENLGLPLPFTKNFGPYSSNDASVREKEMLDQAAGWSVRASVNDALLEGELGYWSLVSTLKRLLAFERHSLDLKVLLDRTERLYRDRLCTEYDLAVVKSAYAGSLDSVEQGVVAYVTASNALVEITDSGNATLFLPRGYDALAALPLQPLPGEDRPDDVSDNPWYEHQLATVAVAELSRRHMENQALPNLRFTQVLTLTQATSTFGFNRAEYSLSHVFTSPDMIRQDYGLIYSYPLFNRAAEAARERAELESRKQLARARMTENSLRREAADALALLDGARRRIHITDRGVALAREAFDKALDMQADREVTEYEIVSKSSALLTAELAAIAARMDCQVGAARFLAALGAYQKRYMINAAPESQGEEAS